MKGAKYINKLLWGCCLLLALFGCKNFNFYSQLDDKEIIDPLILSPDSVTILINHSTNFSAQGGVPPYTFSVVTGTGSIVPDSGVYLAPAGASTDVVRVTDTRGVFIDATVSVSDSPTNVDYRISTTNYPPTTGATRASFSGNFRVTNDGTADGSSPVYWYVYLSDDLQVDGGDSLEDSGVFGALNAAAQSGTIGFGGTWPDDLNGSYYLLIVIAADDDGNMSNNTDVSPVVTLATIGDGGTAAVTEPNQVITNWDPGSLLYGDTGAAIDWGIVLKPGDKITITGITQQNSADLFQFDTGTAGSIRIDCTWTGTGPNRDYIDVILHYSGTKQEGSFPYDDYEGYIYTHGTLPSPTQIWYISVGNHVSSGNNPLGGSSGAYTLRIEGLP